MSRAERVADFTGYEEIRAYQLQEIQKMISYASLKSKYYRDLFKKLGLEAGDIRTWEDFEALPLTSKEDLRNNNWDFVAVPQSEWSEMFSTSGTTGEPVYFPYTKADLERLGLMSAQMAAVAGVRQDDTVHMTVPLASRLWIAGLCFWLGFQKLGCCTLRYGSGDTKGQLLTITSLRATALFAISTYALHLGSELVSSGRMKEAFIRVLLCTNENLSNRDFSRNALGQKLDNIWGADRIRAVYGNTEVGFSGSECEARRGYHTPGDFICVEVVDPETGKPMPFGEPGVLVVTPLGVEGLPLIRYNVGDVTTLMRDRCSCGRSSPRFGAIEGRLDQMVKVKGAINVYPSAVETLIFGLPEVQDHYIEAYTDENNRTAMRVTIAVGETTERRTESQVAESLRNDLREALGVRLEVQVAPLAHVLDTVRVKGKRKPQRFRDSRKKL